MKKTKKKLPKASKNIISFLTALALLVLLWTQETHSSATPFTPPVFGDAPELFANQAGDQLKSLYLNAIQKAEKSIFLIIYTLTEPDLILALKNKAEEGVSVCVICDAKASGRVDKKLGPAVHTVRRIAEGLMHQKILVVDEKETWLGSANFTGESLLNHGNLVAVFPHAEFSQAVLKKAQVMSNEDEGYEPSFKHQAFHMGGQNVELWFFPDDTGGVKKLLELIKEAKTSIKIGMYTWTRLDLANAVIQAAKRGVDVQIVLDRQSSRGTSQKIAALLKQNKIALSTNTGKDLLHHKFIYIDQNILVNGSANWTKAAFTQNDDCYTILNQLNASQKQKMDQLWKSMLNQAESY